MSSQQLKDLIVSWNLQYTFDRRWRKKYNIPFGSERHLAMNQIDIYLDLLEDRVFEELEQNYIDSMKKLEEANNGNFLKEQKTSKKQSEAIYKQLRELIKQK